MKLYLAFILLTCSAVAQLSTDTTIPPTFEYDMLTLSTTVLKDLSGNGNNSGTITGTTTNSQGRTCNGTTDWISMSQLLATGPFTVFAVATSANAGIATWGESNNNASQFVRFSTTGGSSMTLTGASAAVNLSQAFPTRNPDWDIYMMRRTLNQLDGAMLSRFNAYFTAATNTNIGTITVAGGGAGICALNEGATQVNFWGGSLAYLIGFNFALTDQQIQAVYNALATFSLTRSIFIHPYPSTVIPAYTSPVWTRRGTILCGGAVTCNETAVLYDSTCPLTGSANCFSIWYSVSGTNIGYAESPDAGTWTNSGAIGTAVVSGCIQPTVVAVGKTYHMFCTGGASVRFDHYTSTNKITWTLSASGVITTAINALTSSAMANPSVLFSPDGSGLWYMLFGCRGSNTGFSSVLYRTCGATTSDPAGNSNWTFSTANPFLGFTDAGSFNSVALLAQTFGNPDLHYIPNAGGCPWWEWDGSYGILRFASCTFNDLWIWSQVHPSLLSGSSDESNQLADPALIQVGNSTYMFYNGYSTNSSGTGVIKLAIANMPLLALIQTNEGVISDWP